MTRHFITPKDILVGTVILSPFVYIAYNRYIQVSQNKISKYDNNIPANPADKRTYDNSFSASSREGKL